MAAAKVESKDNIDQVFVVGYNYGGEFGLMHTNNISELTEWTQNISIKRINCGAYFTIITDHNNDFWCAGRNDCGQLGLCHSNNTVQQFVQNQYFRKKNINIKSIMTNVSCYSTLFLSQTNKLYECGYNSSNQPVLIDNVTNIKDAQRCYYFTILLDNNGIVSSRLQTGADGIYNFSNTNSSGFHPIPFFHNKRVTQISVGYPHALFMDSRANIWCCGRNDCGQLGLGHYTHSQNPQLIKYFADNSITITKMCSGAHHNLCVDESGIVYAFGLNNYGQCGLPKDINKTHTPIKIYTLSKHKIIDIKCGSSHSYCKSDADKHWLFGYNGDNECTLTASRSGRHIFDPFCINETVRKTTNGKQIKEVYVGNQNTWIITGVITKVEEILNKNNASLQETKDLIAELDNAFSDNSDSKDEENGSAVPKEMCDFFSSVQDDLGNIAEAQSQLQNTMELFNQISQHKPDDYDSNPDSKALWDSILENTQNTMQDIEMVQDMRDDYIGDMVEITECMNKVESDEDSIQLTKQIKAMSAAQQRYKAKIVEATQNALKSLKSFMTEKVGKEEVDGINNDIIKYQKLNFEADKEINTLHINKAMEIKSINAEIEREAVELNRIKARREDIEEELDRFRRLKIGRKDFVTMRELKWTRENLRAVECKCTRYKRCASIHVNHINCWAVWQFANSSTTLEGEENKLNEENTALELDQHRVALEIDYYTKKKAQVGREYEQKIAEQTRKSTEYQNKFQQSMTELDKTIKKTGVSKGKLTEFVNLTQSVMPSLMKDQESMNRLSTKCTASYTMFITGIQPARNKYEIRRYLSETNQYEQFLDVYISALSQANITFMHEMQCDDEDTFNDKILSVLKKRFVYFASNNSGVYGSFRMNGIDLPTKVMRIFANICCNNKHWGEWCMSSDIGGAAMRRKTKKFTSTFGSILGKFQKKKKVKQISQTNYVLSALDVKNGTVKCLDNDFKEMEFKLDKNDRDLIKQITETHNIGLEMKEDVYITVKEVCYSNKTKKQAVSKAFIKNDGETKKINELEAKTQDLDAKNQDLDAKNQELDAKNQEKDREIALLTEKLAAQNRKTDKKYTIEEWLTDIVGLPQYIDNFVEAALEMDILAEVTDDNLKEIEITKLGHRVKIMKAIKDMRDATGTK